ncbi:uncharacterized protein J3D65DRAFT_281461 [Phyllosticta citribraziliensis]|uniref:Uncharacterized protein n=1 Tax=Phyllosticta citribraziliensis TaxID=989973 RepID=A0ABR1LZK0_9PEZI
MLGEVGSCVSRAGWLAGWRCERLASWSVTTVRFESVVRRRCNVCNIHCISKHQGLGRESRRCHIEDHWMMDHLGCSPRLKNEAKEQENTRSSGRCKQRDRRNTEFDSIRIDSQQVPAHSTGVRNQPAIEAEFANNLPFMNQSASLTSIQAGSWLTVAPVVWGHPLALNSPMPTGHPGCSASDFEPQQVFSFFAIMNSPAAYLLISVSL